ncbi:hypothetical protein [Trichloromonas sp.]|uniref:hypothetical protein n=1 Tax=Trichloromonas sp. TaxID=3069249 RepID=UPI003D81B7CE
MIKQALVSLIILLAFPFSAMAIPAINCHCFTDRAYDPSRPEAADPYFLAATQNTFFATVFGTEKKMIVRKKQQGTSMDDLWIAYWVAEKSDSSPESLLETRGTKNNWSEVSQQLGLSPKTMGASFANAVNNQASAERLAQLVVDDLFTRFKIQSEVELAEIRKKGISNPELILATLISAKTNQPAEKIYLEVTGGPKTWGEKIDEAKIDISEIQKDFSILLK